MHGEGVGLDEDRGTPARWRITDGAPQAAPAEPDTAGGWAWVVDRDRLYRSVWVYVMLDTLTLEGEVAEATLDAIDTKGLSEVVKVLGLEEPPQRTFMGVRGHLGETRPAAPAQDPRAPPDRVSLHELLHA